MPEIVVSDQQAQLISEAHDPVEVRDSRGRILGVISRSVAGDDSGEIEEMKRRMQTRHRSYSTTEVVDHLHSLETK
jgi:hypothetical protein